MNVLGNNQKFQLFEEGDLNPLIQESKKNCIVLLFTAEWLGSAYLLEGVLLEMGHAYSNLSFYKVNTDDNPALTEKMDIRQLPTSFFFIDGEIVGFIEGLVSKNKVREKFTQAINKKK